MDVHQVREGTRAVEEGLRHLQELNTALGAVRSHFEQAQPPGLSGQAPSAGSFELHVQRALVSSHIATAQSQLTRTHEDVSRVVDALKPILAAAPNPATQDDAEASVASGPSYRLIHRSGNPPPVNNQGQARRRLSRDELANVFGHLQPLELTRYRRPLGTPLFHQSAANYTNLVIDCEDGTARRMWAAMPLAVALRWGKRATNVREIKHRWPAMRDGWCRGTWVALVEGHAIGRGAIADKKRREREGGEGAAAAAAGRDDDGGRSADEGTLEVLSFERVVLDRTIRISDPPPSSALPPAPAAPVHLPALKTVDKIRRECLAARVGRQWRTPAVKTLIPHNFGASEVQGARAWLGDCDSIGVLNLADETAGVLSVLPADGKTLKSLRTLRGVRMYWGRPADIDRLREVLVARGVSRSIRELEIGMGWMPSTDETVECSQNVARLIDAIAHPEAVEEGVFKLNDDGTCGRIDAELLSRSSSGSPAAGKLISEHAKRAGTVVYSGGDEAHPAAITDDTFPAAHTLKLLG
ncbi:unnamed protein product [Vitrella brassicaformis CCMP3155]|uniref:Uncharacterized protein n=1 Tax=Vitrella brassicaformis (strain CCMP3155) TaxID=1169540 RepID=A0A0G4EK64_VITBC|nr:unnamed protein product [Vitrella brassicaformis CCMP3155]|eukprot:CEL96801.1 unnamed protein product [Vitrella brassicaformis CCMP3155]